MKELTERQKELLITIFQSMSVYGRAPSYSEMVRNMGVSSKQAIAALLLHLIDGGYLKIADNEYRGIFLSGSGVKALIDCGVLREAIPQVIGRRVFYEYLPIANSSSHGEHSHFFETINGNLALSQLREDNTGFIEKKAELSTSKQGITQLSSAFPEGTGDKAPAQKNISFSNCQNLFIVNPDLKKYFSGNRVHFEPSIKTDGIFSILKTLLGV